MENHNYFVVIPAYVLMDSSLSDKQKLLIGLITNLSNIKGYCFSSNKYLSECLQCSESTIKQNLSDLEERKYIVRVVKLNQNGLVEFRTLTVIDPPSKNRPTPGEIQTPPPSKNRPIITKYNNKEYISFDMFWDLYNKKLGDKKRAEKQWDKLSDKTRQKIIDFIPFFQSKITDYQFVPYPTTFLSQQRWNDDLGQVLTTGKISQTISESEYAKPI